MEPEIIVVFADPAAMTEGVAAPSGQSVSDVLSAFGAALRPLIDPTDQPPGTESALGQSEADLELARYYKAEAPEGVAEALAESLRALPDVETVYIKPAVENPLAPEEAALLEAVLTEAPAAPTPPGPIPIFTGAQGYLGPAPHGVDVNAAWPLPGGKGQGVEIIDIEGGWRFSHVDLKTRVRGLKHGVIIPGPVWEHHGTAVLGEISADDNPFGVVGIAPHAHSAAVSHQPTGSAAAIRRAAALVGRGGVVLLEMHRPGPRFNYHAQPSQAGYIAVEWWPDDYLAIVAAVEAGVIVIEAAGNGAEDLDDPLYDQRHPAFPASWANPFRGARDSGAIVVGAGAPAGGAYGPPRSRLDFSNYGNRVDCQGWGRGVVTTGYGDLYRGASADEYFTSQFSGTSSASPIVTGVAACLQGIARAKGRLLTPAKLRQLLRTTGSPQTASPIAPVSQRIGSLPDLRALIPKV